MGIFRRQQKPDPEQLAALSETARSWITTGFFERDGLVDHLVEFHDDIEAPADVLAAAARDVVAREWQRRLDEQAGWTGPGDYQRLVTAFDSLSADGFVCRMNFSCCNTCGTDEIDDERTRVADVAEGDYPFEEWAYTFFHQQDGERLGDTPATLFLTYSTFRAAPTLDPDLVTRMRAGDVDARAEAVRQSDAEAGRRIRDALVGSGLSVDWNGDPGRRIAVTGIDWRKPLPVSS